MWNQLVCLCRVSCMWLSSALSRMFKSESLVLQNLHSKESVFYIFLQERLKFGIFKPRLAEESLFDHIYYLSISNLIISFTKYESNVSNSCQNKGYPWFPLQFQAPKKMLLPLLHLHSRKSILKLPLHLAHLQNTKKYEKYKSRENVLFLRSVNFMYQQRKPNWTNRFKTQLRKQQISRKKE